MTPEQLRIAIANSADPAAKAMLADLSATFDVVHQLDQAFGDRINANKAARGEGPTKLSKRKREELAQYEQDRIEGERNLTESFAKYAGSSIIAVMSEGLEIDLKFWGGALLKHAHPADRPLIEEVVAAKKQLQSRFKEFLERFPAPEYDEDEQS